MSMIRTYIYGVPDGFDFYEKDALIIEYFKGFYIASRRGRRLVINRRENGETIYSYLCYGLREVRRQPLHSFFGMSLVVPDYQYCPDLKRLLGWFDFVFEKILSDLQLFRQAEDGATQYRISKFEESRADIEWIKSILPNIFTQDGQAGLVPYDDSFTGGKTGQVANFNRPVTEERILAAFKEYCWVAVAAGIVDHEIPKETSVANNGPVIELDYGELNQRLGTLNAQLLPMAIDISKAKTDELEKMEKDAAEISDKLRTFVPTLQDTEEYVTFSDLKQKYAALLDNIASLKTKQQTTTSAQPSPDDTDMGNARRQEEPSPEKQEDSGTVNDTIKKIKERHGQQKSLLPMYTLAIVLALAVLGILFGVVRSCSSDTDNEPLQSPPNEPPETVYKETESDGGNSVDEKSFYQCIEDLDIKGAYACIDGKVDADPYKPILKECMENAMWNILDNPDKPDENEQDKKTALAYFKIEHKDAWDLVGFTDADLTYWQETVLPDYIRMKSILSKTSIKEDEYQTAMDMLEKYPNRYDSNLKEILKGKIQKTLPATPKTEQAVATVTYTDTKEKKTIKIDKDFTIYPLKNSSVTIEYPGKIMCKDWKTKKIVKGPMDNKLTIEFVSDVLVVYCGNMSGDKLVYKFGVSIKKTEESTFKFILQK